MDTKWNAWEPVSSGKAGAWVTVVEMKGKRTYTTAARAAADASLAEMELSKHEALDRHRKGLRVGAWKVNP
jgi:hypothetical protein